VEPERCVKRRLWKRVTLPLRAPVGEPGEGSFSGTLERQMEEGSGNEASLINLLKTKA